nr:cyclase family protein [Geomicrobium halophilum]
MPIIDGMEVYSGDPPVNISLNSTIEEDGFEVRSLAFGSHTGTHVDAFSHMHQGKQSIDEIGLTQFCGKAMRVDASINFPENTGLFFNEEVNMDKFEKICSVQPPFVGGMLSEELEWNLLKQEIVTYTDLVSLENIPLGEPFTFFGLPLTINNGDGSPVRAIALLNER